MSCCCWASASWNYSLWLVARPQRLHHGPWMGSCPCPTRYHIGDAQFMHIRREHPPQPLEAPAPPRPCFLRRGGAWPVQYRPPQAGRPYATNSFAVSWCEMRAWRSEWAYGQLLACCNPWPQTQQIHQTNRFPTCCPHASQRALGGVGNSICPTLALLLLNYKIWQEDYHEIDCTVPIELKEAKRHDRIPRVRIPWR